jgi:predicted CxxxxCH...CXXCH cytochrome family protein
MNVCSRIQILRATALTGCLAVVVWAAPATAALSGSRHDFAAASNPNVSVAPKGACSACHLPHLARSGALLWPRTLTQEDNFYSLATDPNYKPGTTLLCYDCHDDASSTHADADPDPAGWYVGGAGTHRPQDIALGVLDGGPVGYYELVDGTFPTTGNAPKSTDPSVTTGGHYWKTAPATGTPLYKRGDKLPCELCHDPHNIASGTNDVFFLKETTNGSGTPVPLGDGFKASPNVRNHQLGGTGREMCAACHKYSDSSGTQMTLWGVLLPKPPATTAEHLTANVTPCTNCHKHNRIVASCNDCHTYPGLPNPGGATHRLSAVHDAHSGVPSSEAAVPNKGYQCTVCHLGAPHNAGVGGAISGPAQWETLVTPNLNNRVQVRFDTTLNPAVTNPADTTQDSSSYDDATNVCSNLSCHGADPTNFGPVSGTNTTPDWDQTTTGACGSCHDTGTNDVTSPGTSIGTGNHSVHLNASWGPALGTDKDVACLACHPAYERSQGGTHADGVKSFLHLNNSTVTNLAATDGCNNCHGASTANAKTPANWANGSYVLGCLECHDSTDPANSLRNKTGVAAPAKNTFWTSRGHGNLTTYPWTPNRSGANLACTGCHAATSAHINGSLGDTDRLTTAGNSLCSGCHGTGGAATKVSTHANTSGTMAHVKVQPSFELNCVECHDVHGTANIFMINPTNPDGPLVATRIYNNVNNDFSNYLYRGTVAFTDASVGTSATNGVGYAQAGAGDTSKICQTCHTLTGHYQYNSDNGHETSGCSGCHPHDFDGTYTAGSQDGFMPRGNCRSCHDSTNPFDPDGPGPWPAATPINLALYDSGGHGKGTTPAGCTDCHDTGQPVPNTHQNHTYNSVWENGPITAASVRNTNTAHLKTVSFTPYQGTPPAPAAGLWGIQVTFDRQCYLQCHQAKGVNYYDHQASGALPTDNNYWSIELGTSSSRADGDRGTGLWYQSNWGPGTDVANAPFPIDCDLNTDANCADTDYAPCISCHDPHGTSIVDPVHPSKNFMLRRQWLTFDVMNPHLYLCKGCH